MSSTSKLSKVFVGSIVVSYLALLVGIWLIKNFEIEGSSSYITAAHGFLDHTQPISTYRPPLYPLLLAGLISIFGEYWKLSLGVTQIILAVFVLLSIIHITFDLTKSRLVTVFSYVLWFIHLRMHFEVLALRETILYTAILLSIALLVFYWKSERSVYFSAAIGFLAGCAFLCRPTGIFIAISALLFLFTLKYFGNKFGSSAKGSVLFPAVACFFLVASPWQYTLYRETHQLTWRSSTTVGLNLWKGNNKYFFKYYPFVDVDRSEDIAREITSSSDLTDPVVDKKLAEIATSYILEDVGRFTRSFASKAFLFFAPFPVPLGSGDLKVMGEEVLIDGFRYINPVFIVSFVVLSLILFSGTILLLINFTKLPDEHRLFVIFTFLVILSSVLVHSVTFPESRFRIPIDVFFVIYSSWVVGLFKNIANSSMNGEAYVN